MTTLTAFRGLDMSQGSLRYEAVLALTSTQVTLLWDSYNWSIGIFNGHGFSYDGAGLLTAGTLTSYEARVSGNLAFNIAFSGLSITKVQTYILANDVNGLYNYALAGSDSLIGSNFNDRLMSYAGSDVVRGNAGDDRLEGGSGDDWLIGGPGRDTMIGGIGNDWYTVDRQEDVVIEEAGQGAADRVLSSATTYHLGSGEIEILQLADQFSADAQNLTGNTHGQTIVGNAGANIIDGGGSTADQPDVMIGLDGNDWYFVRRTGDQVVEAAGGGQDRVFVHAASWTLRPGSEVELVTTDMHADTDPQNLTGNELANHIWGNDGSNTLDGAGGADRLVGLAGNDRFIVDNLGDMITEAVDGGSDRVLVSASYNLNNGASVELITTTNDNNTQAMNIRGNDFANVIYGNAGQNILSGLEGNDILFGLGGRDYFLFERALNATTNADHVRDFEPIDDSIWLSRGVFSSLPAGSLPETAFRVGSGASTPDHRIIYESASGRLFFDHDGVGGASQVLFATLTTHPTIDASDFLVV